MKKQSTPKTALDHLDEKLKFGLMQHHVRKPVLSRFRIVFRYKDRRGWPYARAENGQVYLD